MSNVADKILSRETEILIDELDCLIESYFNKIVDEDPMMGDDYDIAFFKIIKKLDILRTVSYYEGE